MVQPFAEARCGRAEYCVVKHKEQQWPEKDCGQCCLLLPSLQMFFFFFLSPLTHSVRRALSPSVLQVSFVVVEAEICQRLMLFQHYGLKKAHLVAVSL